LSGEEWSWTEKLRKKVLTPEEKQALKEWVGKEEKQEGKDEEWAGKEEQELVEEEGDNEEWVDVEDDTNTDT